MEGVTLQLVFVHRIGVSPDLRSVGRPLAPEEVADAGTDGRASEEQRVAEVAAGLFVEVRLDGLLGVDLQVFEGIVDTRLLVQTGEGHDGDDHIAARAENGMEVAQQPVVLDKCLGGLRPVHAFQAAVTEVEGPLGTGAAQHNHVEIALLVTAVPVVAGIGLTIGIDKEAIEPL